MSEAPTPTAPDAPIPEEPRPPFNEISVLFPLLSLYSAAYLALMVADFALKESFNLPDGIMPVYVALLGAYAADKEVRRWLGAPEPSRKGSVFVYLWLLLFLGIYLITCFRREVAMPNNLVSVSLQVLGIFFGSKASKYIHETRQGREAESDPGRERVILDFLGAQGQATRQMVADELRISHTTAGRLLVKLESMGAIARKGSGKGTYYALASKSPAGHSVPSSDPG